MAVVPHPSEPSAVSELSLVVQDDTASPAVLGCIEQVLPQVVSVRSEPLALENAAPLPDDKLSGAVAVPAAPQKLRDEPQATQVEQDPRASGRESAPGPAQDQTKTPPKEPGRIADLLCLELFAGSCRLSSALADVGFQTLAVDSREAQGYRVLHLDLLQVSSQELVLDMIRKRRVFYVHCAPPCSTSSQARSIPVSRHSHGPRPLRTFQQPDGRDNLSFVEKTRVRSANRLYEFTATVLQEAQAAGCLWSVENPAGSFFWQTSWLQEFRKRHRDVLQFVQFHNCCFGGKRPKLTALWCNTTAFSVLNMLCRPELGHKHEEWGWTSAGFATQQETSYPLALCKQWAHCLLRLAKSLGHAPVQASCARVSESQASRARLRANLGFMPRSSQLPPQVDPYVGKEWRQIPPTADLASVVPGRSAEALTGMKNSLVLSVDHSSHGWKAEIGRTCGPQEFTRRATAAKHPLQVPPQVPPVLDSAAWAICTRLPEVHRHRCQMLHSMCQRAQELQPEEDKLHLAMPPHVRRIMKGKRILLLQEILDSFGFPDKNLCHDLQSGFPLSGWLPESGHMEPKVKPPLISRDQLEKQAHHRNKEILAMTRPSGDSKLDEALWEQTVKDVTQGWASFLDGPLQADSVLSRRFAVDQSGRVRAIDDFSVSRVNEAVGSLEKITVMSTGDTVALCLRLLQHARASGTKQDLVGRCFDLKAAYRQLAICSRDLPLSRVAVWNPVKQEASVLQMWALPFGASGSVWNFIRVAIALWAAGAQVLQVPWTTFYDDFTVVSLQDDVRNLQASIFLFFQLLGWKVAVEGDKAAPFSTLFQSLGVLFDLSRSSTGQVIVSNTERRREEVRMWCLQVLKEDQVSPAMCAAFASRVRWLESQMHGRLGRIALQVLLSHASPAKSTRPTVLTRELKWAVTWILNHVPDARPKVFRNEQNDHFILFTDGAVEEGTASLGGVLLDDGGSPLHYFSCQVPNQVYQAWVITGTSHPVFQAELLAVLVATHVWAKLLLRKLCSAYVDNEGVKHALIRGQAFPDSNSLLLRNFLAQESVLATSFWFCRVPSSCNPADAPSRGSMPSWLCQANRTEVDEGLICQLALSATGI